MLEDGTYDVIVVDAVATADPAGVHLELAVLDGPHKGEVVPVLATGLALDEVDALGTPGTLTVADGHPSVVLEP